MAKAAPIAELSVGRVGRMAGGTASGTARRPASADLGAVRCVRRPKAQGHCKVQKTVGHFSRRGATLH